MANEIRQTVVIEASLTQIQSQLKTLEGNFKSSLGNIQSIASTAFSALGIGLGVGALVAFGKKVIETGDQLSDLSDQSGLSVEVLGGIRPVLEANNSSLDGFVKGIGKAQKSLGDITGDGAQAAEAFKAIGLNARELATLSPDEFLEKFVNALAKVENRNERLAIANRILKKSAEELIPTILQLAENGIPKLDKATADAYRTLGAFKDQLVFAGAKVVDFGALILAGYANIVKFTGALLNLRELSADEKFGKFAADIDTFTAAVSRSTGIVVGRIEGMSNDALNEMAKTSDAATKVAIDNLVKTRQAFDRIKGSQTQPGGAPLQNLLAGADDSKIKKLESALQSYRDSLIKTITAQELEEVKLKLGDQAALQAAQAYQVLGLKASLAADNLATPPEVETAAAEATATLKNLGANVEILGEKNFAKLQSGALAGAAAIDALRQSLDTGLTAVQAFADAANESVGIQFLNREDVARQFEEFKRLQDQFKDLQKSLAIEILPPEQQGAAKAVQEFEERIKAINKWRVAAIAANEEVEKVNEEAAQATADAWVVASQKMKETADEQSEFMRRALERTFDAVADAITDALDNGFKSWTDFGEKIRKVLNKLAADFLTLQAKEALFGKDGKEGILSDIFGTKKPTTQRIPGTTAADTLDTERGRELRAASGLSPATQQFSSATTQFAAAVQQFASATQIKTTPAAVPDTLQTATGIEPQAKFEQVGLTRVEAVLERKSQLESELIKTTNEELRTALQEQIEQLSNEIKSVENLTGEAIPIREADQTAVAITESQAAIQSQTAASEVFSTATTQFAAAVQQFAAATGVVPKAGTLETGTDVLDAEQGQELITAATAESQAAVQAQAATAEAVLQAISAESTTAIQTIGASSQTSIQTSQTTAVTGIQGSVTSGQASINATQTAAVGSIEAVKEVAIAAINAVKNAPPAPSPTPTPNPPSGPLIPFAPGALPVTTVADTLDAERGVETIQVAANQIASEGVASIQTAGSTAEKGIAATGALTKTGIDSLLNVALTSLSQALSITGVSSAGVGSSLLSGGLNISGGILANLMGTGGGAAVGYGSRPLGVEGPLMANGGFFSSALGGLMSFFGFHEGGEITRGGETASFKAAVFHTGGEIKSGTIPAVANAISVALPKLHDGGQPGVVGAQPAPILKSTERMIVGETGEFMFSKEAVRAIGVDKLVAANRKRELPPREPERFHEGGSIAAPDANTTVVNQSFIATGHIAAEAASLATNIGIHTTNIDAAKAESVLFSPSTLRPQTPPGAQAPNPPRVRHMTKTDATEIKIPKPQESVESTEENAEQPIETEQKSDRKRGGAPNVPMSSSGDTFNTKNIIGSATHVLHKGGDIGGDNLQSRSVALASLAIMPRLHGGGSTPNAMMGGAFPKLDPGEVLIIAKEHEFVINDKSAAKMEKPVLEYINEHGELPPRRDGSKLNVQSSMPPHSNVNMELGTWNSAVYHAGGFITGDTITNTLSRYHSGGDVSSMINPEQWSNSRIMAPDSASPTGTIPMESMDKRRTQDGGRDGITVNFNVHGATDADSFRRSRSQIESDLARAVQKGMKRL